MVHAASHDRRATSSKARAVRKPSQDNFRSDVQPKLEVARRDWLIKARKVALDLARTQKQVTCDDVRKRLSPPKNVDGRVMGVLFHDGNWVCVGYRRSTRSECHHRPIGIFELAA